MIMFIGTVCLISTRARRACGLELTDRELIGSTEAYLKLNARTQDS